MKHRGKRLQFALHGLIKLGIKKAAFPRYIKESRFIIYCYQILILGYNLLDRFPVTGSRLFNNVGGQFRGRRLLVPIQG